MSDIGEDEAISFDGKFEFMLIVDDVTVGQLFELVFIVICA